MISYVHVLLLHSTTYLGEIAVIGKGDIELAINTSWLGAVEVLEGHGPRLVLGVHFGLLDSVCLVVDGLVKLLFDRLNRSAELHGTSILHEKGLGDWSLETDGSHCKV